jgi:hypothetical protein
MWYFLLFLIATTTAFPLDATSSSTNTADFYDHVLGYRCTESSSLLKSHEIA